MSRKKTHEEYVAEVAAINPNIEVIETYVDNKTKLLHRCKIDGHEWRTMPKDILRGKGCPKCSGTMKKTHEEYVKEVAAINADIEVIGTYINAKTKILHKCKIDGYEWYAKPNDILNNHHCPYCNGYKKSHEQYVEEVAKINGYIEVVGKYLGSNKEILHRCLKDGYEWKAKPSNILAGNGCPKCAKQVRRTHNEYVEELKIKNPFIVAIEEFTNVRTKIKHKCLKDGYVWSAFPSHILEGRGCPMCAGNAKKTHEQYIDELNKKNPFIMAIDMYIDRATKIKHKCLKCGNEWFATPANILSGSGCPECKKSRGEKNIESWLIKNNIMYESQKTFDKCKDKYLLRFDFYLPDYNIAVEYQGKQHYEPIDYFGGEECFEGTVRRDKIKEDYCKENNILLIAMPYFSDIHVELEKLYKQIKILDAAKEVTA